MSIVLTRIDDRLVHGQVIVGWAQNLCVNRIVVCDDNLAASEWERSLYTACTPPEIEISFYTESEFAGNAQELLQSGDSIIVLVESPQILARLVRAGVQFPEINIGGMHHKENSKEFLPYVFLSSEDLEALDFLQSKNIEITCQDTPSAKKHALSSLLAKIRS